MCVNGACDENAGFIFRDPTHSPLCLRELTPIMERVIPAIFVQLMTWVEGDLETGEFFFKAVNASVKQVNHHCEIFALSTYDREGQVVRKKIDSWVIKPLCIAGFTPGVGWGGVGHVFFFLLMSM